MFKKSSAKPNPFDHIFDHTNASIDQCLRAIGQGALFHAHCVYPLPEATLSATAMIRHSLYRPRRQLSDTNAKTDAAGRHVSGKEKKPKARSIGKLVDP